MLGALIAAALWLLGWQAGGRHERRTLEERAALAARLRARGELSAREVQRRIEGHEHTWELYSMGRGFVRSERCTCGVVRLRKGGAR